MYRKAEFEEKLSKAREVGIDKIVGVPFEPESNRELYELSREYSELLPTVGIHPHKAVESGDGDLEMVSELMRNSDIVAVGEVGVDLHFLEEKTRERQLDVFRKILGQAIEFDLPVILHCPRAEPLVFEEVEKVGVEKVIFHWFTGPHEILRKILARDGYYISVTPAVHYSGKLQKVVDIASLDSILVESDGPTQFRSLGKGEPSQVPQIIEKIGEIKGIEKKEVAETTNSNAEKLFIAE